MSSPFAIRGILTSLKSARDLCVAEWGDPDTTPAWLWELARDADEAWQARLDGQVAYDAALREDRVPLELADLWAADTARWDAFIGAFRARTGSDC